MSSEYIVTKEGPADLNLSELNIHEINADKLNTNNLNEFELRDLLLCAKKNVHELVELTQNKDKKITELNLIINRQSEVIIQQIQEIQTLYSDLVKFQFYRPHRKDHYVINFGHAKYRGWSYRRIISSREGKKLCSWVLTKTTVDTEPIKEFKKYLREVNYSI